MTSSPRTFRQPNFFAFLIVLFAIAVAGLILFGSIARAADANEIEASLLANPIVLVLVFSSVGTLCTFLLAHQTGCIDWLKAHVVFKGHEKLTASADALIDITGRFATAELQGVASVIAAVGPNPTAAEIKAASAQAVTNAVQKAKDATSGTAILADAKELLGAGLDAHLTAAAGAAVTNQLLKTTGT